MTEAAVPDVRPAGAVLLRALAAGAVLGGIAALVLTVGDGSDLDGLAYLAGVLIYACPVGAGLALLSATGWLLVVGHGARWVADVVAALVAGVPFAVLWVASTATIALVAGLVAGVVAALVARWQGYERDRRRPRVRPTSSPRAG